MNHNMDTVTTTDPLTTDASIVTVVNLNTLYKNEIAKKIILGRGYIIISPGKKLKSICRPTPT